MSKLARKDLISMEPAIYRPTLSIVIPTLNEELWLSRLLRSISPLEDIAEIIIADNQSTDGTVRIAELRGCKIVEGGRPARARNNAAKIAGGDILLFIDADAIINEDVMMYVRQHFMSSEIQAVHFRTYPISPSLFVALCYKTMDYYFAALSCLGMAQGVGSFMAIRRDAFCHLSGFDENLSVGEDLDMFRRLNSLGTVMYERRTVIYVSTRRFTVESPLSFALKCPLWAFLRLLGVQTSLFPYRWIPYSSFAWAREEEFVQRILEWAPRGEYDSK